MQKGDIRERLLTKETLAVLVILLILGLLAAGTGVGANIFGTHIPVF